MSCCNLIHRLMQRSERDSQVGARFARFGRFARFARFATHCPAPAPARTRLTRYLHVSAYPHA